MRPKQVTAMIASLLLAGVAAGSATAQDMPAEYQQVLDALGKKGDYKANVFKLNIPRSDLKVTVDGVALPTSFGFGGWLAMTKGDHGNDVMMGDLVLLQDEVNPVMSALLDNGLEITALHNHFFWENPRIFFMHVHGMGKSADLARKVKPAVDLIGHLPIKTALQDVRKVPGTVTLFPDPARDVNTPVLIDWSSPVAMAEAIRRADTAVKVNYTVGTFEPVGGQLQQTVTAGSLDTAALNKIVGATGEPLAGGVFKFTIGRDDLKMKEMGATINARMGLNTWAAFFGSDDNAVVAGDVAMLENEITPVLKALRGHGLNVVAMHHHMAGTRPMIIFLHYWGRGRATVLAEGFRSALDELGKKGRMEH